MPDDEPETIMPAWPQPDTPLVWPGDHVGRPRQPVRPRPRVRGSIRLDISRPDKWYDLPVASCMARWRESLEDDASGRSLPTEWSEERKARHRRWARLELGLEIDEIDAMSSNPGMPSVPAFTPGVVQHRRFSKGEPVPDWLEWTVVPGVSGVLGVDAECVFGSIDRLREMYPGTFLPKARPDEPDRFSSYMAPVEPLRQGEGLIRYRDAMPVIQVDRSLLEDLRICRVGFRTGGPESIVWQRDGSDLLFMAHWRDKDGEDRDLGPTLSGLPAKPLVPAGTVHEMRFAKGTLVPNWLSDWMTRGIFDVDARCLVGSLETLLAQHPGLLEPSQIVREYKSDISYLSPIEPLKPGECLIRYGSGGEVPITQNWLGVFVGGGGPDAVDWLRDGMTWRRVARPLPDVPKTVEAPQAPEAPPGPRRFWQRLGLGKG